VRLDSGARRIVISGLTAAGKTTHAKKLADYLGLEYFSSSEVLGELTGLEAGWSPSVDMRRKGDQDIDRRLDMRVLEEFRSRPECVFDAWALPWYCDGPAIRMWIESDFPSRVRKCIVSRLERGDNPDARDCLSVVRSKDQFSRDVFQRNHGFDLFTDRRPFDLVVSNSSLIPTPTIECAHRGIAAFHTEIIEAVREFRDSELRDLRTLSEELLKARVRSTEETLATGSPPVSSPVTHPDSPTP
jgi:cytidylate kinase